MFRQTARNEVVTSDSFRMLLEQRLSEMNELLLENDPNFKPLDELTARKLGSRGDPVERHPVIVTAKSEIMDLDSKVKVRHLKGRGIFKMVCGSDIFSYFNASAVFVVSNCYLVKCISTHLRNNAADLIFKFISPVFSL